MEWVETTGKTVEEAKELALDQLGVDSGDAEFEVLEEPKVGLFGRSRGVARVKARVSPKSPRPKTERRRRTKKSDGDRAESAPSSPASDDRGQDAAASRSQGEGEGRAAKPARKRSDSGGDSGGVRTPREPMDIDEQQQVLVSFLEELASAFGLEAKAEATVDGEELRVNLVGDQLGLLVGPRLATLDAIQEIARNTLQRQADGREYARVVVDVQGVRLRRREALEEFVVDAARQVRDDGVTVVFEVMSSADRKVVHDVASGLEGVQTASEGEDPRRRVVLRAI